MPALTGRTPAIVFGKFRDHLSKLLNQTVTDARLSVVCVRGDNKAMLSFRRSDKPVAAPLRSKSLFFYVGQNVEVEKDGSGEWRLRTVQYRYWIQGDDSENTDSWFFRFEYVSRKIRSKTHPRHHLHLPCTLECGGQTISLKRAHIPTGWVTLEEVIRFIINDLGVKPKSDDWDKILLKSEEQFRDWTSRTI